MEIGGEYRNSAKSGHNRKKRRGERTRKKGYKE